MKTGNAVGAVIGVYVAWVTVVLAFWGAVIYTVCHFVSKYW